MCILLSCLYKRWPNCLNIYEGKSLYNRNFIITFLQVLIEIVCVLFIDIVPLFRNTLGPPVDKLVDAL